MICVLVCVLVMSAHYSSEIVCKKDCLKERERESKISEFKEINWRDMCLFTMHSCGFKDTLEIWCRIVDNPENFHYRTRFGLSTFLPGTSHSLKIESRNMGY